MDIYWVVFLVLGASLGIFTLPWSTEHPAIHVLAWAAFWPYLALHLLWQGLLAYRTKWWRYRDRRLASKHESADGDASVFKHYTAGKTVREMYMKRRSEGQ